MKHFFLIILLLSSMLLHAQNNNNIIWQKMIGCPSASAPTIPWGGMQEDSNGNLYIVGQY